MTVNLSADARARRRVWDLPVRTGHALLITCVAGAWLTREAQHADLHAVFGYCALGLVAFRVSWGLIAQGHARFASFAYPPSEVLRYLRDAVRGVPRHYTGHNPAGSWSVFALLALLAAVSVSGVLAIGGLHDNGPLAGTLSFPAADRMREWHDWLAWAVLGLALLHVCGVAWGSRVHRENLAAAMVTGRKLVHDARAADTPRHGAVAAAIAAATLAFAGAYLFVLAPKDIERRQREEVVAKAALASLPWTKECGSCHLAYVPGLLPLRSWERTLDEQNAHFGEDLGLSAAAAQRLLGHARTAPPPSWAGWKLAASVPAGESPLEVSATPYWRAAHERIEESSFRPPASAGRHDCEACHADAVSGIFHPRMIHIPKARVGS